jgi:hypothetical protein
LEKRKKSFFSIGEKSSFASFYLSFAEIEESGEKNKWDRFAAEKSKIFLSSLFFQSVALALNHPLGKSLPQGGAFP